MKTNVIFIATVRLDCKDCYECGGYMKPHKTAYFRDQKTATDWNMNLMSMIKMILINMTGQLKEILYVKP
jgi:hypothetical protein